MSASNKVLRLADKLAHSFNKVMAKKSLKLEIDSAISIFEKNLLLQNFFSPSITNISEDLSRSTLDRYGEGGTFWIDSLDQLLCKEICKNLARMDENVRIIEIKNGIAELVFLGQFHVFITIIPSLENSSKSVWFITRVNVESSDNSLGSSLSGVFQSRFNYAPVDQKTFCSEILQDCERYIDLFYFEKLLEQFEFLMMKHGKEVVLVNKLSEHSFHVILRHPSCKITFLIDEKQCLSHESEIKFDLQPNLNIEELDALKMAEKVFLDFFRSKLPSEVGTFTDSTLTIPIFDGNIIYCRLGLFESDFLSQTTAQLKFLEGDVNIKRFVESLQNFDFSTTLNILKYIKICAFQKWLSKLLIQDKFSEFSFSGNFDDPQVEGFELLIGMRDVEDCFIILRLGDVISVFVAIGRKEYIEGFFSFNSTLRRELGNFDLDLIYTKPLSLIEKVSSLLHSNRYKVTELKVNYLLDSLNLKTKETSTNHFKIIGEPLPCSIKAVELIIMGDSISLRINFVAGYVDKLRSVFNFDFEGLLIGTDYVEREIFANEISIQSSIKSLRIFELIEYLPHFSEKLSITASSPDFVKFSLNFAEFHVEADKVGCIKITSTNFIREKEVNEALNSSNFSVYEFFELLESQGSNCRPETLAGVDSDLTWLNQSSFF